MHAARDFGVRPVLVGDPARIATELRRIGAGESAIEIVEALDVIEMHEHPAMALRRKRRSSIALAVQQVREGRADAVVSAGHTGAVLGACLLYLGRIKGIDRPAVAAVLPSAVGRPLVLLDAGANVDCKPQHLVQFAQMGSIYAREALGVPLPRVGLLSNGEEDTKGNDATIRAAGVLRDSGLNFVGNIEGKDLFFGLADVVVCDGFVGNVVLKCGEGLVLAIRQIFASELGGWRGRLLSVCLLPLLGSVRGVWRRLDYREQGGAPLLGVEGVCVVAHGRSGALAVRNAIRAAGEAATHRVPALISAAMREREAAAAPGAG